MTGDILLDIETMKPLVKDGDFVIGDATAQNQKILLLASKGELKRNLISGVGALSFIEDETTDDLIREIRKEYVKDGMVVGNIKQVGTKISVDAKYVKD